MPLHSNITWRTPKDRESARSWLEQTENHLDGRTFARPIRTKKAEDFPTANIKVNLVDR
jgi:hypothetical protein